MVIVIASLQIKPGMRRAYLDILKVNVPKVLAEEGCRGYEPTVDIDTGLPVQILDENVVTIVERWESVDALKAHLTMPHMREYRERTKDMVEKLTIKVLKGAWPEDV